MYDVIMQYLNSFLSCSIRNLTLASLSLLFTIKIDVFPFLQVLFPQLSFSMKAITENEFYDLLINNRHSCKKHTLLQNKRMRRCGVAPTNNFRKTSVTPTNYIS